MKSLLAAPDYRIKDVGALLQGAASLKMPSYGVSDDSKAMTNKLQIVADHWREISYFPTPRAESGIEEQLYDALAFAKLFAAKVAMHLDRDWRSRLFRQLDNLLALDDWEPDDQPPQQESFATFLRMLLALRPTNRPGLGATSDGHLIAAWTAGQDRLTIECLPSDRIRWVLSRGVDDDVETAAGTTDLTRLSDVLQPYNPSRWFQNAIAIHST